MSIVKHIIEHEILGTVSSGSETGSGEVSSWSGEIEFGEDTTYHVALNVPYGGTITSVTTRSDSGTATGTVEIGGVALGGTANSISSAEQTQSHSTSNSFSTGQDITLVLTSSSNPQKIRFTIAYTRL